MAAIQEDLIKLLWQFLIPGWKYSVKCFAIWPTFVRVCQRDCFTVSQHLLWVCSYILWWEVIFLKLWLSLQITNNKIEGCGTLGHWIAAGSKGTPFYQIFSRGNTHLSSGDFMSYFSWIYWAQIKSQILNRKWFFSFKFISRSFIYLKCKTTTKKIIIKSNHLSLIKKHKISTLRSQYRMLSLNLHERFWQREIARLVSVIHLSFWLVSLQVSEKWISVLGNRDVNVTESSKTWKMEIMSKIVMYVKGSLP